MSNRRFRKLINDKCSRICRRLSTHRLRGVSQKNLLPGSAGSLICFALLSFKKAVYYYLLQILRLFLKATKTRTAKPSRRLLFCCVRGLIYLFLRFDRLRCIISPSFHFSPLSFPVTLFHFISPELLPPSQLRLAD